jgi:hypothetical protein
MRRTRDGEQKPNRLPNLVRGGAKRKGEIGLRGAEPPTGKAASQKESVKVTVSDRAATERS